MSSQCREVNPSPNFPRCPSGGFLEPPVPLLFLPFKKNLLYAPLELDLWTPPVLGRAA